MSGIYIHIPFCKRKCHYCNFFVSKAISYKTDLIKALLQEINIQKKFLDNAKINTIYFGGGSPSLLDTEEIKIILNHIFQTFTINDNAEITLEANPEDLSLHKIMLLKETGINRLSIGTQSFNKKDLDYLGREHDIKSAVNSINNAYACGINNISIDLIYGIPSLTIGDWENTLKQVFKINIPHVSAYSLTVEPDTPLDRNIKKGKRKKLNEELSAHHFELLIKLMEENEYQHYEISNFCKGTMYSKHNTGYWTGSKYLGIGPSAHSYNGIFRQWNIADLKKYTKSVSKNTIPYQREILTASDQYNEYILTSLRTMWGCNMLEVKEKFGSTLYESLKKNAYQYIRNNMIKQYGDTLKLTNQGKLIADRIIAELFT